MKKMKNNWSRVVRLRATVPLPRMRCTKLFVAAISMTWHLLDMVKLTEPQDWNIHLFSFLSQLPLSPPPLPSSSSASSPSSTSSSSSPSSLPSFPLFFLFRFLLVIIIYITIIVRISCLSQQVTEAGVPLLTFCQYRWFLFVISRIERPWYWKLFSPWCGTNIFLVLHFFVLFQLCSK